MAKTQQQLENEAKALEAYAKRMRHEFRFTREMRKQLLQMVDSYIAEVKQTGLATNLSTYAPDVIAILRSNYKKIGKDHDKQIQRDFGAASKQLQEKITRNLNNTYNQRSIITAQQIITTTQKQSNEALNAAVQALLAAGAVASPTSISDSLTQTLRPKTANRAKTIAATETTKAVGVAQTAEKNTLLSDVSYKANNLKNKPLLKQWVGVLDAKIRPDHADADGQTVEIDQPFNVGGYDMMYPGDENAPIEQTANCRCTMSYTQE